ncbi:MAG: hypothetical protein GEU81_12885 [Nitriliruptorales bacterium]|nr:hypothetical protein [Nitriliruptorales bacterium]
MTVEIVAGAEVPTTTHTYAAVELFLFSAASWHPHRVHFDQAYTRDVEGHTDILVHGPLQAVHLFQSLTSALDGQARLASVSYRHRGVLYVGESVVIRGRVSEVDDERRKATVEMWMEKEGSGEQTTTGKAMLDIRQ